MKGTKINKGDEHMNPIGLIHDKNVSLWQCPLCEAHIKYTDRYSHLFIRHRQWFESSNYSGRKPTLISVIPLDEELKLKLDRLRLQL
jgi:hypothetical protein